MTHYQRIEQEAIGSNGVFTYRTAKDIGIRSVELLRWIRAGKVIKAGHGVYRLAAYPIEGELMDRALFTLGNCASSWKSDGVISPGMSSSASRVRLRGFPLSMSCSRLTNVCRRLFAYRKMQPWPTEVVQGPGWDALYQAQRGDLPVLPSVDKAIVWANGLIARIDAAK